jgi:hypothetical protein
MIRCLVLPIVAAFLALAPPAAACMRPYESPERVIARATVIVEIEILSTTRLELDRDLLGPMDRARARAMALRAFRGALPIRELDLIGGPVDSCALGGACIGFERGERFWLLLEDPIPPDTEAIHVFRDPRIYRGSIEDLRALQQRVAAGWDRRIELLRSVAPDDLARAEMLALGFRATGRLASAALAAPYPTLLALAEVLRDPRAPLPRPPRVRKPLTMDSPFTNEPRPKRATTYLASWGRPGVPAALEKALEGYARTRNAATFRRRLLRAHLVEQRMVDPDLADRFVRAATESEGRLKHLPLRWLSLPKDAPDDLAAVRTLLRFADPEPDWLVKAGGRGHVDRNLLVRWLARNPDSVALTRWHRRVFPEAEALLRELRKR